MAGIGNEAVVPLQTNGPGLLAQAVAPLDRVVSPDAVAAVTDAFRKGQISADDIIERYGELAKTKDKAQIQNLHEFISPDSIQARQNAVHAANTDAILKSSPEYQAAQQATFQSVINKANEGDLPSMRQAMLSKGWPVPSFDPAVGYTPGVRKQTEEAFQEFSNYADNIAAAAGFVKSAESIPTKSSKTTIDHATGQQKTVETVEQKHFINGKQISEDVYNSALAFSAQSPGMWKHMGKPQFVELFGVKPGKFGGGVSGPLSEPVPKINPAVETFPAIGVTPKIAPVERPVLAPSGEIVTSIKEEPVKEPPASEITEKEKLISQVSNADQFQEKLDRARVLVNDANIKPVGPGYSEGARTAQLLNGIGAFLGIDSATLKNQTQDQLRQFLAQHVQATIRSMAGSGNRVMKAEVDNSPGSTGLFYQAAPQLTSTPETWNIWLNDMARLFQDARKDAILGLPADEREKYATPASAATGRPVATAAAASAAKPNIDVGGGGSMVWDAATGKYKFVPGGSTSATPAPSPAAVVPLTGRNPFFPAFTQGPARQ